MLYLRIAKMPADLINVGDALTLTVDVGRGETVILSRGCDLVAFASSQTSIPLSISLPNLRAAGIDVTDGGATCASTGSCNWSYPHAVTVSFGGETATVSSGQTAMIGRLSFVNDAFVEVQNNAAPCDGPSWLRLAGFRVP